MNGGKGTDERRVGWGGSQGGDGEGQHQDGDEKSGHGVRGGAGDRRRQRKRVR